MEGKSGEQLAGSIPGKQSLLYHQTTCNLPELRKLSIIPPLEAYANVDAIYITPPTYAFRNEKYWAMFMEANRLR